MQKRQFTVYGRVQGVGFRFFTCKKASALGLVGSVRNLSDGAVLVIAVGDQSSLDELGHWLQQGPATANVTHLIVQDYQGSQTFDDFAIVR